MRFKDKVVIVTGGAGGIGRAAAVAFAGEGACVAVADYHLSAAEEVVESITAAKGRAAAFEVDVADADKVAKLAADVAERFGGIHVLLNGAGVLLAGGLIDIDESDWKRTLDVNLTGTFYCSRAVVPYLQAAGGGAIVNTSSSTGEGGAIENAIAYIASKGGVSSLTRCMALELINNKIRVNAVCPGPTKTPMLEQFFPIEEQLCEFANQFPSKRLGEPEEIAAAVLFLASDEASYVTGCLMAVDGGQTAGI